MVNQKLYTRPKINFFPWSSQFPELSPTGKVRNENNSILGDYAKDNGEGSLSLFVCSNQQAWSYFITDGLNNKGFFKLM